MNKVYVVSEYWRDNLDNDFRFKVFGTLEKALDYMNELNKEYYRNYEVEEHLKKYDNARYEKTETSFCYFDEDGSYELAVFETEVE